MVAANADCNNDDGANAARAIEIPITAVTAVASSFAFLL
jgi:hypothetical protein